MPFENLRTKGPVSFLYCLIHSFDRRHAIDGAHQRGTRSRTSIFKPYNDSLYRFVLSCGKDSTVKLWEVGSGRLVKQYLGATHTQLRCQVCQEGLGVSRL